MTKIVVNRCHGGFGLSDKALRLYQKRKYGRDVFAYKQTKYKHEGGVSEYSQIENVEDNLFVHYSTLDKPTLTNKELNDNYISDLNIERNDPILIEMIEELGSKEVSGNLSELEIVEIPNGIDWEIEEYDGAEWVSERHQTW
jgi:hypothetical protein